MILLKLMNYQNLLISSFNPFLKGIKWIASVFEFSGIWYRRYVNIIGSKCYLIHVLIKWKSFQFDQHQNLRFWECLWLQHLLPFTYFLCLYIVYMLRCCWIVIFFDAIEDGSFLFVMGVVFCPKLLSFIPPLILS